MRKLFAPILIVFVLAACGTSMLQRYALALDTYNTALSGVVELRRAGKIDDAAFRRIDPIVQSGNVALERMKDAALSGKASEFSAAANIVEGAVTEFLRVNQEYLR